jgi:hypothetical protein
MVHQNSTNHGENFSPGQGNRKQVRSKRRRCPWRLEDIGQLRPHTSHYPPPSSITIHYYPVFMKWADKKSPKPLSALLVSRWVSGTRVAMGITSVLCWRQQVSNEPPEREDLRTHNAICAFLIDSDCIWHVLYIPYWWKLIHIDPYWSVLVTVNVFWQARANRNAEDCGCLGRGCDSGVLPVVIGGVCISAVWRFRLNLFGKKLNGGLAQCLKLK